MTDERVTAITSIINRNNSGLGVTERRVTEYLAKRPYLKGLDNDDCAQAFIAEEAEREAERKAHEAEREAEREAHEAEREAEREAHEAELKAAQEVGFQKGIQHKRYAAWDKQTQNPLLPPAVAATTASSLDSNSPESRNKKAKYEEDILPPELYENSFVHVKSYFHFVKGCAEAFAEGRLPKEEAQECFGSFAFKTWFPVENKTGPNETKRSLALCRAFGKELHDEMCLDVQHQTPISPNQEKLNQNADLCFFVQIKSIGGVTSGEKIIAELEYKPHSSFPIYETQASAYGTDLMSIDNTPIIIIQAHGTTLSNIQYRVFGIVPKFMTAASEPITQSNYRKVLLFQGSGLSGFAAIAAGLRGCVAGLKQDGAFDSFGQNTKVSSVASVHSINGKLLFIKSYDYRLRPETPMRDRRQANFPLVCGWIDEEAKHFQLGDHLEVVVSRFYEQKEGQTQWFAPFPVCNLGLILKALGELHKGGYVHGDIRLFNFLLHVGKLVDFDHTRGAGDYYPSTLRKLEVDGKRANAVSKAIDDGSLSTLKMDFAHDLESMMHALQLLQPTTDAPQDFADWWSREVVDMSDFRAVLCLQEDIAKGFSDEKNRLEFKDSIMDHCKEYSHDPVLKAALTATDSPNKHHM